jgi:putative salt-induced outer membrane protein
MTKSANVFVVAAVSTLLAGAAAAQSTTFSNSGSAEDGVTAITDAIDDDARDVTFGNEGRTVGTYGSVALRATGTQSTTSDDIVSVGIGANYGFFDGVNGSELNLVYTYGSTNGVQDTNSLNAGYDYTRDFSRNFFGYASINLQYDGEADATTAGDTLRDAFAGFGVGYRIVNNASTQWALKAGPGYRMIEQSDGATFVKTNEAAYSVESNLSYSFSDTVYASNDTTIIGSDIDTTVLNELALNVAMSNALSLRTSYVSEFSGADFNSLDNTQNTAGVSIVYNFN